MHGHVSFLPVARRTEADGGFTAWLSPFRFEIGEGSRLVLWLGEPLPVIASQLRHSAGIGLQ